MSKKYTKVYSDTAYAARLPNVSPSVLITATNLMALKVKAPSEGRLTSLTIQQDPADGTQVTFEVEALFSQLPFPIVNTNITTATAAADVVALYRILPKQIGAAGFPVELNEETEGFAYRNIDGNNTNNQRYIYIVLAPGGFGTGSVADSHWKIEVTVESDVY